MNYYYFENNIEVNNINNLVEKLHSMNGEIILYFSTSGGETSVMNYLIKYLNSRKDEIKIVLTNKIYSAGVYLLLDFKGKLGIEDLDSILFHAADREIYSYRKDSYFTNKKIIAKQDKEFNLETAKKIKKKELLTNKQLKQFLKGYDVVVYKEQFEKWKLC